MREKRATDDDKRAAEKPGLFEPLVLGLRGGVGYVWHGAIIDLQRWLAISESECHGLLFFGVLRCLETRSNHLTAPFAMSLVEVFILRPAAGTFFFSSFFS